MGLRSLALKRSYAKGNRVKNMCAICGKPIYNRMMFRVDPAHPAAGIYVHQSCAKVHPQYEWERAW
jgi:hypothetical protein